MTRDGQTHRDYGTHGLPASDWKLYAECHRCSAESGQPCLDLRVRHVPTKLCWMAHPNRPLISVLDGAGTLVKSGLEEVAQLGARRCTDADLEARRALNLVSLPNQARTGRARWNTPAPCKSNGHLILVAETDRPYGRSLHSSAYLSHILTGILTCWKNGRLVLSQARWRCGARTHDFILLNEPNSVICPACKIERLQPEERERERRK